MEAIKKDNPEKLATLGAQDEEKHSTMRKPSKAFQCQLAY